MMTVTRTATTTTSRSGLSGFRRKAHRTMFTHKMVCVAAAAAFSTSTHAWTVTTDISRRNCPQKYNRPFVSVLAAANDDSRIGTTRLHSSFRNNRGSNDNDDNDKKELFGFRRGLKNAARKILPTKWFGTKEEKEKLERKQMVKDRVKGELDQMLKGAPPLIQMLGKYVAAPMMGKMASKMAEMSIQQEKEMEAILDEARDYLMGDLQITDLLGTPIQIGRPFSQRSSTTVINGRRQMRTEFAVELSGPYQTGVSRIIATTEGIGQLLVETNGRVYEVDLTSKGRSSRLNSDSSMSGRSRSRSSKSSFGNNKDDDDNIIEAEIIDKKETR